MRHLVKGRKLGRTSSHRNATMKALSVALIKEHRIVTTLPKAKELRTFVEPLITRAKEDTSHNRRKVFSQLMDKKAASLLFDEVALKAKDRPGGYTRVIKIGTRSGDGAEMAVIELVDYNDIKPEDSTKKKRTRRAGKSSSSKSSIAGKGKSSGKSKDKETKDAQDTSEELNTDVSASSESSSDASDKESKA
jgi:large subunit ribosomal protein L17